MKTAGKAMASERGLRAAEHLGRLIHRARVVRGFTQEDLAKRARVSTGTVIRMERGETGVALWTWLNAMEVLGLLQNIEALQDATTDALVAGALPKRVGKPVTAANPDF